MIAQPVWAGAPDDQAAGKPVVGCQPRADGRGDAGHGAEGVGQNIAHVRSGCPAIDRAARQCFQRQFARPVGGIGGRQVLGPEGHMAGPLRRDQHPSPGRGGARRAAIAEFGNIRGAGEFDGRDTAGQVAHVGPPQRRGPGDSAARAFGLDQQQAGGLQAATCQNDICGRQSHDHAGGGDGNARHAAIRPGQAAHGRVQQDVWAVPILDELANQLRDAARRTQAFDSVDADTVQRLPSRRRGAMEHRLDPQEGRRIRDPAPILVEVDGPGEGGTGPRLEIGRQEGDRAASPDRHRAAQALADGPRGGIVRHAGRDFGLAGVRRRHRPAALDQ